MGDSSNYGHYIGYCYREKENKYFCFNDENARSVNYIQNQRHTNSDTELLYP